MGIAIVAASQIFGQRAKANKPANSAYECGVVPEGQPHPRFGARFYVVAMLFVIFDIEVVFLIPEFPLACIHIDCAKCGEQIYVKALHDSQNSSFMLKPKLRTVGMP